MLTQSVKTPWIAYHKPNPRASIRLFCFPFAGGAAGAFRSWAPALPSSLELCLVQLPGRETRAGEPFFNRLRPLVESFVRAADRYFDEPFAFVGHSMGALIAFETTRRLRSLGRPLPRHLFVSSFRSPRVPSREPRLHEAPDDHFLKRLRAMGGTPPAVIENAELMELFMPVLRADFAVCGTYEYHPEPPLDCPISVFGGRTDTYTPPEDLDRWREETTRGFSLDVFDGGHFYMDTGRARLLEMVAARASAA